MVYGTHDFAFLDFSEQDLNRIAARQTANGVSFANILTAANNAMAAAVTDLDPIIGALTVQTDQTESDEDYSAVFQVEYGSEYAVARPQRSVGISHMLPIRKMDVASQFTEEFLDNASEARIASHLDGLTTAFRRVNLALSLDAVFNPAAQTVTDKSTTESPKLVGYDANDPAYGQVTLSDGTVIASPYSHYLNDTPANLLASIDAALVKLKARGVVGPFDIVGTDDAITAIAGLTEFYETADPLIGQALGEAMANLDSGTYAGALKGRNVRVRHAIPEIQDASGQYWFAVFKTFGQFAPGNVVGWRYDERYGVAPVMKSRSLYPLDYATAVYRAGFGINNRFGAVAVNIETTANGYTAPTISG